MASALSRSELLKAAPAAPPVDPSAERREDRRFVTGSGLFVDDLPGSGVLAAAILRAPHASAAIRSIDVSAARRAPGIVAVLTAEDARADGCADLPAQAAVQRPDGSDARATPRPLLAGSRVRHVGEPIALVIGESAAAAQDALELIEVDYDARPGVATAEQALRPGAPAVWEDVPDNLAFLWRQGDAAAVEAAFAAAAHVTRCDLDVSRVTAASLEPRGAMASLEDGTLVLHTSHQGPYQLRDYLSRTVFKDMVPVRVVVNDVGGSFGMKMGVYREDVLVAWAARRLGRPVRWTGSRSEAFMADDHARDVKTTTELALDRDGVFTAFRVRGELNIGAYLTGRSLALLNNIGGIAGVYRTPHIAAEIRGVFTHTTPTAAYRGAGRPEATYLLERTIDVAAGELGLDAFELRRRNLVSKDQMPYRTGFVFEYDSGDFARSMDMAETLIDRAGFPERRTASAARGRLRGLGVANPIEVAGGPFGHPGKDHSRLTAHADGTFTLECGVLSTGQGLETAMTRLVADRLGVPAERIGYRQGDTGQLPAGRGQGGSSGLAVGGTAVARAVERLLERARDLASDALEASPDDLEFTAGGFVVAGTDRRVSLAQLAGTPSEEPDAGPRLAGEALFQPEAVTFPNGCHICEVEITPETGEVRVVNYVAVEDVGRVLNPVLVAGQMHGGIAQGIGQALKEAIVHDASGELVTGSFNDYGMPLAVDLPSLGVTTHEVPTAVNSLGVKGAGEAGTVGALAATMNAVCDALAQSGVRNIDMPASPERVWAALRAARPAIA